MIRENVEEGGKGKGSVGHRFSWFTISTPFKCWVHGNNLKKILCM